MALSSPILNTRGDHGLGRALAKKRSPPWAKKSKPNPVLSGRAWRVFRAIFEFDRNLAYFSKSRFPLLGIFAQKTESGLTAGQ